jgi:hypothetical protein
MRRNLFGRKSLTSSLGLVLGGHTLAMPAVKPGARQLMSFIIQISTG